jgi:hypothetical protein
MRRWAWLSEWAARWQRNPSARQLHRQSLDKVVKQSFDDGKGCNGAARVVLDLADAGHHKLSP